MTRDPEQEAARVLDQLGAEIVEASFENEDGRLEHAFEGVEGAFSVQNTWTAGVDGEIEQGRRFAEAAAEAGVDHFVYTSVGGAERETGVPHFESKWIIEQHIRSLDLPATILRPVFFMENWAQYAGEDVREGRLLQPLSPDTVLQQIAVDDIGAFAAMAFEAPDDWIGREVELAGDALTMEETARIFGAFLDREVVYVQIPWSDFEEEAGEEMTAMYRWFENDGYEADLESLRERYPKLQDLETFLMVSGDWEAY